MTMAPETKEALRGALAAARSNDPRQHADLLGQLQTESFLGQLDSEAEYQMASKFRLHVAQVVDALARNAAPSSRSAFVALLDNPVFLAHDERIIALIRASVHVRPAPAPLVAFWDSHCQPEDGFDFTTITALIENGTMPALVLLEKKMADPSHDDEEKISWMRTEILSHRNDVALLKSCERLLLGSLPENLQSSLVEALFDYQPDAWYTPAKIYSAPRLDAASREALDALLSVGVVSLTMVRLTDVQRLVVKERLEEAEKLRGKK